MKVTPSPPPRIPPALPAPPVALSTPPARTSTWRAAPPAPEGGGELLRGIVGFVDAAADDGGRRMAAGAGVLGIAAATIGIAQARRRGDRPPTAEWLALGGHLFQLCGASGLVRAHPIAHGVVTSAASVLGTVADALREADALRAADRAPAIGSYPQRLRQPG